MRLCFDATRFGFGLKEAVQLCASKKLPAVEYTFQPFAVAGKGGSSLKADEKSYLADVRKACQSTGIEIACINLDHCLDSTDRTDVKKFQTMVGKLARVAEAVGCHRLSFWLSPSADDQWISQAEPTLTALAELCARHDVKPLLRLSTPRMYHDKSLRKWRPLEPQEWRDVLVAVPAMSLSFSPADCAWQGLDYLQILPAFASAIEHVEARDVEINRSLIVDSGLFGPLWWRYRLPGKGQVDWRQLVEASKLYDFQGSLSVCLDDEFVDGQDLEESLDFAVSTFAPYVKG